MKEQQSNIESLISPSANSYFLHAHSAVILRQIEQHLKSFYLAYKNPFYDQERSSYQMQEQMQNGLFYTPLEDKTLLLAHLGQIIIELSKQTANPNLKNPKILISSFSQSLADQLFRELQKYIRIFSTNFSDLQMHQKLIIKNYTGRIIQRQMCQTHKKFLEDLEHCNIMIINNRQLYEFIFHGIIRLKEDFQMVIFEDLSQHNDKNHVMMMRDYYYNYLNDGVPINHMPLILGCFNQIPALGEVRAQLQGYSNDLFAQIQKFNAKQVDFATNIYECIRTIRIAPRENQPVCNEDIIKAFSKDFHDIEKQSRYYYSFIFISNSLELLQYFFRDEKQQKDLIRRKNDQILNILDIIPNHFRDHSTHLDCNKNQKYLHISSDDLQNWILSISDNSEQQKQICYYDKDPPGKDIRTCYIFYIPLKNEKQPEKHKELDVRQIVGWAVQNQIKVKEIIMLSFQEDIQQKINMIVADRTKKNMEVVQPFLEVMKNNSIRPSRGIIEKQVRQNYEFIEIIQKRTCPQEKFDNQLRLTMRDSQPLLKDLVEMVVDLCDHGRDKPCRIENLTEKQIEQQKIDIKYLRSIEKERKLKELHFITRSEQFPDGIRYYYTTLLFPKCWKDIINYFPNMEQQFKQGFRQKKDAESFACLKAIEYLREYKINGQNLIDDHLFLNHELFVKKKESEMKEGSFDNDYIQRPIKLDPDNIHFHVFAGKNPQEDYYPFCRPPLPKESIQELSSLQDVGEESKFQKAYLRPSPYFIGFVYDKDLSNMKMDYQIFQDLRQRHANADFLILSNIAKSREEAFHLTQDKILIDYEIKKIDVEFQQNIPFPVMIQKLKFFHCWSYYNIAGFDYQFLKGVMKGKFSFCNVLFEKEINLLKRQIESSKILQNKYLEEKIGLVGYDREEEKMLFKKFFINIYDKSEQNHDQENFDISSSVEQFDIDSQKLDYIYSIPFVKCQRTGEFKINFMLIDDTIKHMKTKISELLNVEKKDDDIITKYYKSDLEEKSKLWNQLQGFKTITQQDEITNDLWNKIEFVKNSKQQSWRAHFNQKEKLTLAQFYKLMLGIQVQRSQSKYIYKFHRLLTFFECTPNKSIIANETRIGRPDPFETIVAKEQEDEPTNYQRTFSQCVEEYPLNYEQYSLMQHAFTHFMKLNDFLRTKEFVQAFFGNKEHTYKESKLFNFPIENQPENFVPKTIEQERDLLLENLPLINEALTSPQTQLLQNYERLEIYGDSLISLLVIVELYLDRESTYSESDLDGMRKKRISNDNFIEINIQQKIYQYMVTEPHNQGSGNTGKSSAFLKQAIPGGLRFNKMYDILNNVGYYFFKSKLFYLQREIVRAIKEHYDLRGKDLKSGEFEQYKELLQLIMTKKVHYSRIRHPQNKLIDEIKKHLEKVRNERIKNDQPSLPVSHEISNFLLKKDINYGDLKYFILYENLSKFVNDKLESIRKKIAQENQQQSLQLDQTTLHDLYKHAITSNYKTQSKIQQSWKMTLKFTKEKKLADVIEALSGAIMQASGLRSSQAFLQRIGVLRTSYENLIDKIRQEHEKIIPDQKTKDFVEYFSQKPEMKNVERILKYNFKNKAFLLQALTHKSFADHHKHEATLLDYNLMEFLGDSILNFLVIDFFYKNSRKYREHYPPNTLHKLKTEVINNFFLSLIMIDYGLEKSIQKSDQHSFDKSFYDYVDEVQDVIIDKETGQSITMKLYQDQFEGEKNIGNREAFMDPVKMNEFAKKTEHLRYQIEDLQDNALKVFGDIFEALVAAVFLDSEGDLSVTQRVIMDLIKPYLYVYGNVETLQQHPRTQVIDQWAKESFANIKDHPIKISHSNSTDIQKQNKTYKGQVGGIECISETFLVQEMNQLRKFYKKFKEFVEGLATFIKTKYPNIDMRIRQVNGQSVATKLNVQQLIDHPHKQQNMNFVGAMDQLEAVKTTEEMEELIKNQIKAYRQVWIEEHKGKVKDQFKIL